jgi:ATP-dependent DNA helicase RecQ
MSTVHAAKGMEFDHVIISSAGWSGSLAGAGEEERRLYYVAMTRARQTLCLLTPRRPPNPHIRLLKGQFLLRRPATPRDDIPADLLSRRYELLGLQDIDLGFAGSRTKAHPTHQALANLQPGSLLRMRARPEGVDLADNRGRVVARLSRAGTERYRDRLAQITEVRVVAMLRRQRSDEQPEFQNRCRSDRWEVPLVEVVY